MQLKWRLLFEFVTVKSGATESSLAWPTDAQAEWTAPAQIDVDTMTWQVGLKVFPAYPYNMCLLSPYVDQREHVLVIE